jgi:hypothetical protein
MNTDLQTLKATAQATAEKCPELLVTVPAGVMVGLIRDAERYRWLRLQPNDCSAPRIDICHWTRNGDDSVNEGEGLREAEADEAIDTAMTKEAQ